MRLLILLVCAAVASVQEHDLDHSSNQDHDQHVLEAIPAIGHYEVVDMHSVRFKSTLSAGTTLTWLTH